MESNVFMQLKNRNSIIEKISESFSKKPKKVYIVAGTIKEAGFKLIEEEMLDTTAKLVFAVGIDKKNTVKSMLETMLACTKDVYIYSNNNEFEFETSMIIFEYADKALVITLPSTISENSLTDNVNIYMEIQYDFGIKEEEDKYKEFIKNTITLLQKETFTKITKTSIEQLINDKEIFSMKQYNHTVKSIAELVGKSKESQDDQKTLSNEDKNVKIPKVDLSDIDIDFDFSDIEEEKPKKVEVKSKKSKDAVEIDDSVDKSYENDLKLLENLAKDDESYYQEENSINGINSESEESFDENETLDIEDLLFSKADIKLDVDKSAEKENKKGSEEDEIIKVKKVNLNNITNLIFELPAKPSKGQDVTSIKIPNYIKQMVPEFFGFNENSKNVEIDGSIYKIRDINLEIIDAKENQKYNDRDAKIVQKKAQSYLYFSTEKLREIGYEENDIARIIKLSDNVYHIEIISKDLQEYKLWAKICNQKFKASSRKYGMM